jgi:hypothetical protein
METQTYIISYRNGLAKSFRTKMGMKKDILQEIEEKHLKWYGHVMQTEDYLIARRVAQWNLQEKRRYGRPVSTWKDEIGTACKEETSRMKNILIDKSGGKNIMSLR